MEAKIEVKTKVLDNGTRVVFMGPKTKAILKTGEIGIAKCNPTDAYSEDEGQNWAVKRAEERAERNAQRLAKWNQIHAGDRVRFTTNIVNGGKRARLRGECGTVIKQMADNPIDITVLLDRKIPVTVIGRGPSVRIIYTSTIQVETGMVEKVRRR